VAEGAAFHHTPARRAGVVTFDSGAIGIAAALALLATMPVYAVVSRGRPGDPDVARRPKTAILGHWCATVHVRSRRSSGCLRARIRRSRLTGRAWCSGRCGRRLLARARAGGWLVLLGGAADIFDGCIVTARGWLACRGIHD
jgi:hypothetical protein